ncbi:MAG TPA: ABC transporter permease, partial [Vicinamibacterales bacterium]|nr:ABC transporter permease [Vicinamibacterales bacterium]
VTMGVGIGASAVLFTLVSSIVLRPLPYPESDRLVRIYDTNPQANVNRAGVATGNITDWRRRAEGFEGIAGYYVMGRTVSFGTDADVLNTAQVSQDFFGILRVPPVVGHAFTEEETSRASFSTANAPTGPDPVVILAHGVWMQRFGGDANVVGRTLMLERRPFRIVGVMPAGFAMPDAGVQLWIPWRVADGDPRDQHYLGGVARLKAGVSVAHAEDVLNAAARQLAVEYPATNRGWGVQLSPLAAEIVGDATPVLWVLLAAVGLVLLVTCANVSLLSLIRGLDRREETAVRLALGASSTHLIREFLWESALLALIGGMIGAAIAAVGLRLLPVVTPNLPRLNEVAFDGRALVFILAATALSAMLSGLPQAWRRTRMSPGSELSSIALRATESVERHRLRDGIVVIQIATAAVLMTGSGLLIRSVLQLRGTDPGFDPHAVLVAPIFLDSQAYGSGDKARAYYRTLFGQLSALPSVVAVGGATTVPTSPLGPDFERPVWPAESAADAAARVPASVRIVTPGYVSAMGIRVVDGRPIDDRDSPQAPRVLMVSQTLARRMWPGQSPVGRQLMVDYSTDGTYPYRIVGVVGDVRFGGPRSEPSAEIYVPHAQRSYLILNVVVKTAGDPRALMPAIRAALKAVDSQKPAQGLYPLEDLIGATYVRDRQVMVTLFVFASAAIFLAVLSVYGVLSQRVRERSREIGIRMAMGANPSTVIRWVAGSGLRLIALGLLGGTIAARMLSRGLDGLLFGVAVTDGMTTIIVVTTLAGVGAIAALVPSWRAARIDPVRVLRRS